MQTIEEAIESITETRSFGVDQLHEIYDPTKVAALMDSMEATGWQGVPIVVDGEQALTGSHRIAAVDRLWNREGIEVPIPRVEISDLCELYGIDWNTVRREYDGDTYQAAASLRTELPREVVDYLGFDVDGAL